MPIINSIALALLGASLSFLAAWFWFKKNLAVKEAERLAAQHAKLEDRVREMELQLRQVGQSMVPLNAAFQAILIKELTHFHTPTMDALMAKLGPPSVITEAEEADLLELLQVREREVDDRISSSERDAAHILPVVIRRVKLEAELMAAAAADPEMQLVAMVPVVKES